MQKIYRVSILMCLVISMFALPATGDRERAPFKKDKDKDETYSNPADLEAEIRFGRDLAARILGNYKLVKNANLINYVNIVGKSLSLYSGRPELKFYFAVLDTDEINAFATPGGYIFITKGALMQMDNEAQLAAVLSHEIAHVTRRHVVKRLDIRGGDTSGIAAVSGMIGGNTAAFRNLLEASLNKASEILFEKGYHISEELESDNLGVLMASSAGYHPSSLKNFLMKSNGFETIAKSKKKEHPQLKKRIIELNKIMTKNGLLRIKQAKVRRRFHENVKS